MQALATIRSSRWRQRCCLVLLLSLAAGRSLSQAASAKMDLTNQLTSVTVNGRPSAVGSDAPLEKPLPDADHLSVNDQDDFRFGFLPLNLRGPEITRLRYRMDGVDTDWREAAPDQTGISYSHLAGGRYLFHLQEGDRDGAWRPGEVALKVRVWAPWWRRGSAELFYGVAIIGLILLWWRYRSRQINALFRVRVEERVRERTRVAREIEDTLLQGSQGLILKLEGATLLLDPDDPHRQAFEEALNRAETSLASVRDMVEALQAPPAPIGALPAILREFWEQHAVGVPIEFSIATSGRAHETFDCDTAEAAFIGKEAIRRACSSAGVTQIEVAIRFAKSQIALIVRDDAPGILADRPFADGMKRLLPGAMSAPYSNGVLRVDSEPGGGTTVTLTITHPPALDLSFWSPGKWRTLFRR